MKLAKNHILISCSHYLLRSENLHKSLRIFNSNTAVVKQRPSIILEYCANTGMVQRFVLLSIL